MNQQLYFMRLYGRGASPAHPRVTELSDNLPVYQEQAAFTPDMRDVIFMTNRNSPIGSWYDEVIAAAQRTGFDAPDPGSTGTVQFLADFSDPNFRSDLYMLDVRTHDLRELTDFHNVVPEFNWNRNYSKLLWSGIVGGSDHNFITRVGSFPALTASQRRIPRRIPAPGLYGEPIEMNRVSTSASTPCGRCIGGQERPADGPRQADAPSGRRHLLRAVAGAAESAGIGRRARHRQPVLPDIIGRLAARKNGLPPVLDCCRFHGGLSRP